MPRPNLLFFISDQQRSDTLSPDSPCITPNFDRLAARGVRFNRCYAPNPICSPTRASIMTGVLPHTHGMVDCTHTVAPYRAEFNAKLPVFPRRLKDSGYRTAYFGKWHIERSERLENFGFDVYDVGHDSLAEYRRSHGFGDRKEKLLRSCSVKQKGYRDFLLCGVTSEPEEATGEYHWTSRAIEFLKQNCDSDRPWAVFIGTEGPHDPYVVPEEFFGMYDPAAIPRPASFDDDLSDRPAIYRRIRRVWDQLDWPQFAEATACYYAFCTLIDRQVGRLLDVVRSIGQEDETLVVCTADHGDYMGAHRLMLKGIPAFEEAYRAPLIIVGPGAQRGEVRSEIVSSMDLAPTIIEMLLGEEFPCQARSLRPLLEGNAAGWRSEAFAECHGQRFFYTQRILWRERWKYVFNGFDEDELYDLESDPCEMRNLIGDQSCRSVAEEMAAGMWDIIRRTDDFNMSKAQYGMFRFAPVGPEWNTA
ncbi:MAG TPA: sulfatase-like hydrolase/transferase [Candidatus Brocadiia bacterium]|nr:sulfatase-like hydrolase/transferase [Candidatus Brocadiia bacterium]